LFGGAIPIAALSLFLYRDYSFLGESPTIHDLISIFRDEFGFRAEYGAENEQYQHLFSDIEDSDIEYYSNLFVSI